MGCGGFYWLIMVLLFKLTPELLSWAVVVATVDVTDVLKASFLKKIPDWPKILKWRVFFNKNIYFLKVFFLFFLFW